MAWSWRGGGACQSCTEITWPCTYVVQVLLYAHIASTTGNATGQPAMPFYQSDSLPALHLDSLQTYQPASLPCHQFDSLPTCQPASLRSYEFDSLPARQLDSLAKPANPPACQLILPTYPATSLTAFQPAKLPACSLPSYQLDSLPARQLDSLPTCQPASLPA
jgi:hypothetical protein